MYFPQFLIGMSATSAVVAIWTYMATGSLWNALAWTILTLIVLQVGYFVLVVRLIYKRAAQCTEAGSASPVPPLRRDGV
jgi:exopolysaccharide production repressor protein